MIMVNMNDVDSFAHIIDGISFMSTVMDIMIIMRIVKHSTNIITTDAVGFR